MILQQSTVALFQVLCGDVVAEQRPPCAAVVFLIRQEDRDDAL